MRFAFFLIVFLCHQALAAPKAAKTPVTALPKNLEDFLGPAPNRFEQKFRRPAHELKAAQELLKKNEKDEKKTKGEKKHLTQAIAKLQHLLTSELGEHAAFELAMAYREKNDFAKSSSTAEKVLKEFPGSVYADRLRDLVDKNECSQGLAAKREEAIRLLQRCLWRAPWKEWDELETEANALYDHLKASKDPLLDSFIAELIQAMPATSTIRSRIAKEIPDDKLEKLATMARYRTKMPSAAGVKAVYPDQEIFDQAMKLVLKEEWKEANSLFKRFPTDFPQSEHWDRAQFWIARTEAKLGNEEEARKRFTQILFDNPFTYYGLQAAIYLKHDWAPQLAYAAPPVETKWQGSLTSRQTLSLWRLRALLEEGLIDYAREEAKFLALAKGNGAGIGQDDAKGALMMANLFSEAGNYMAAFSHAYAGLSLDPSLLNQTSASLIFPQPFLQDFQAAAERSGVNALLLVSVAKQESAFLPNAVSRADALGLMQLLPVTAKEVLPDSSRSDLFLPSVNTQAGGLYLYKLLDRFQGNIAMALAAYNAGPTRAAQWQKDLSEFPLMKEGFDPDVFIDCIPYAETRKYVGNILRNYAWYKLLTKDGTISSVQELMFQWQKAPKKQETAAKEAP